MKLILLVILSSLFGCSFGSHIEPKYHFNQNLCVSKGFYQGCIFESNDFDFDKEGYYYIGIVKCGDQIHYAKVVESHLEECKK